MAKLSWDDLLVQRHCVSGERHPICSSPSKPMDFIYRNCVQCGVQRFDDEEWQTIKEYGGRAGQDILFCSTECTKDFLGHDLWAREMAAFVEFVVQENSPLLH